MAGRGRPPGVHTRPTRSRAPSAPHSTRARRRAGSAQTPPPRAVSGEPVYVSPQLEAVTGVAAAEWLAGTDNWSQRVHPDDRERTLHLYREAVNAGIPYRGEYRLVDADGAERWFHDQTVVVRD